MIQEIPIFLSVHDANMWWNALPDITKLAIIENLMDILKGEKTTG